MTGGTVSCSFYTVAFGVWERLCGSDSRLSHVCLVFFAQWRRMYTSLKASRDTAEIPRTISFMAVKAFFHWQKGVRNVIGHCEVLESEK